MSAPRLPAGPTVLAFCREVARLRAAEHRRLFPATLNVGHPDGARRALELPSISEDDTGLRFDLADVVVARLVASWSTGRAAWGWLTRPGEPEVHDQDLAWLAVVGRAVDAHRLPFASFVAVTRTGWLDVTSSRGCSCTGPPP